MINLSAQEFRQPTISYPIWQGHDLNKITTVHDKYIHLNDKHLTYHRNEGLNHMTADEFPLPHIELNF
jgi:hypothetical protein